MPNRLSYNVLLLNDDETPMEFVVVVLERFFDMDYDDACRHMLCVHENGMAICGTYFREEAEQKDPMFYRLPANTNIRSTALLRSRTSSLFRSNLPTPQRLSLPLRFSEDAGRAAAVVPMAPFPLRPQGSRRSNRRKKDDRSGVGTSMLL
jgi:hypothetical protein